MVVHNFDLFAIITLKYTVIKMFHLSKFVYKIGYIIKWQNYILIQCLLWTSLPANGCIKLWPNCHHFHRSTLSLKCVAVETLVNKIITIITIHKSFQFFILPQSTRLAVRYRSLTVHRFHLVPLILQFSISTEIIMQLPRLTDKLIYYVNYHNHFMHVTD